jgi:glycosyltransferase involved in cell wall biosynthesis
VASARRTLIVGALPPPSGGVATHCRELASELERHGVEIELCDPRRHGPDGRDGRMRLLYRLGLARLRGDLVHVHTNGHNRGSWKLAALCAGDSHSPSLLTLHSGLAPEFVREHAAMVRSVCERYRQLIAVNESIATALVDAGVARVSITVCPAFTGSSLSFRLPPPGLMQIRRAHSLLVACALAPGPEYGASTMLDAFARVREKRSDAGLVVYGPGTRAPALVAAVVTRGLEKSTHLLGELERERALAVLAAADVFVRPTLADGDAISVREAVALRRRVVASQVGSRPPEAALFPAGDAAACAEQIFHSLAHRLPKISQAVDCLHTLLELYRHIGALPGGVATGTALATRG